MSVSLDVTPQPEIHAERFSPDRATMRLVQAVQDLSQARSIESISAIVRTAARTLSGADGATFILREGDKCHYADEDAISPLWKGQRFPMSACISGWAMLNKKPAVIKDIYEDERIPFNAYRPTFVKSLVMMPIRQDDPIGAIGIYWAERHMASDFEVELLQALANTTAVAMENVRVYAELEQRVEDRTRQLQDANRELETFSYSVSHDLQAPLRHIRGYVDLLVNDHLDRLDGDARHYVERIKIGATRMGDLITDLLRLARFARVDLNAEPVALTAVARQLTDAFKEENPSRIAEFRLEKGLRADGDPALLKIVLENLLGNAWKFTSTREKAWIEFGALARPDGMTAYFVKDNGVGFDMRRASKLFGPFQRLHSEKDFRGTGIGLATVDRIIRRHGGRLWAEAAVDQGATFFFTLSGGTHFTTPDPATIPVSHASLSVPGTLPPA